MEGEMVPQLSLSDFPKEITWDQKNTARRLINQFNARRHTFPIHVANRIANFAKTGLPPSKKSVTSPGNHKYFRSMFGSLGRVKQEALSWEKWWVLAAVYGYSHPRLQPAVEEFGRRLGRPLNGMEYPGLIPAHMGDRENDSPLDDNNDRGEDHSRDKDKGPAAEGVLPSQDDLVDLTGDMSDSKRDLVITAFPLGNNAEKEQLKRESILTDALDALHEIMGYSESKESEGNRTLNIETLPSFNNKRHLSDNSSTYSSSDEEMYNKRKRHTQGVTPGELKLRQVSTEARLRAMEEDLKMERKYREGLELRISNLSNTIAVLEMQLGHRRHVGELVTHNPGATDVSILRGVIDKTMGNAVELNRAMKSLERMQRVNSRQ